MKEGTQVIAFPGGTKRAGTVVSSAVQTEEGAKFWVDAGGELNLYAHREPADYNDHDRSLVVAATADAPAKGPGWTFRLPH